MNHDAENTLSHSSHSEWIWDVICVCILLILYLAGMYTGPGGSVSAGDAAKFQCACKTLSAPHSPGFPVYIISGWIWTHILPFLSTAAAVTLLSAVFMCGALVFFRRGLRVIGVPPFAAFAAACCTGVIPILWLSATEAGPTTSGLFFAAVSIWALLHWYREKNDIWIALSIASMMIAGSIIMAWAWAVPIILIWILIVKPRMGTSVHFWGGIGAGLLCVIAAYAVLWYRSHTGAPLLEYIGHNASIGRMLRYAVGAQFHSNWWVVYMPAHILMRLKFIADNMAHEYFLIGVAFFVLGWFVLWQRAKAVVFLFFFLLIAVITAVIHMFVPDKMQFIQLLSPLFFIGMYVCGTSLAIGAGRTRIISYITAGILLAAALAWSSMHSRDMFGRGGEWNIERHLLAIPRGSTLIADDMYAMQEVLRYYRNENTYIKKRNIRLRDKMYTGAGVTNFFISAGIKEQLDEMGIGYTEVYSNKTAILYAIGVVQEKTETNNEQ